MQGNGFYRPLLLATALGTVVLTDAWGENAKWGAWVDAGAKIGSKRDIGEVDVFLPLAQDDLRLLFADLRSTFDDQSQREGNFGLGYRQMLDNGWNLGGYGFFDRRQSASGHFFSQATVGLEALGPDWDARINGYVPLGQREYEISGSTRIDLTGSSIRMNTSYERAYHGGDAELGWRVPVFDQQDEAELRLYGGGYWFGAPDSEKVAGPRLRMEMRLYELSETWPGSRLTLSGEIQHDEPRGTQEFLGVKLRLPLQSDPPSRRLTPQERRMVDPIIRDVDIVTQQAEVAEPVAMNGQTLSSVKQLSGNDLQTQLNSASAGTLLLLSGDATVSAPVTLQAGQTIRGGGNVITLTGGSSGKTIAYTVPGGSGSIKGAVAGDAVVKMAADSTLNGISVENTSSDSNAWAISAGSGANLRNVTVISAANGVKINSANNVTMQGGRITAAQGSAVTVTASSGLSISGATLVQNGASGRGIVADNAAGSIRGNTITTNGNGNGLEDTNASARSSHGLSLNNAGGLTIADNTITTNGTQANGIHVTNSAGIRISGNTVTTNNYMSRGIHLLASDNARISGNTVTTNTLDSTNWSSLTIAFGIMADNSANLTINDNTVSTRMRGGYGISLRYADNGTVSGNTVTTSGDDASAISLVRSTSGVVKGNTLSSSTYGVSFGVYSNNGLAENNTVTTASMAAISVDTASGVIVRNNRLVGRGDSGVRTTEGDTVITNNTP